MADQPQHRFRRMHGFSIYVLRTAIAAVAVIFPSVRLASAQSQVADTQFSVKRGFFDTSFPVTLSTATPGATIHFTTDGSWPSPTHGQPYSAPIWITSTTVLRAMAFKAGRLPTNVDTHTYLFPAQVIRQPAMIPGWPNNYYWVGGTGYKDAQHDYEMDPAIVNDPAYSSRMIGAMKAIPTLSIVMDKSDFWAAYDGEVERPCSVEILYPYEPQDSEQVNAALAPHSHLRLKRSLRLYFRREYGDPHFRSRIFHNAPLNDDSAADRYDRIVLRAGNNRSFARIFNDNRIAYTRDQWYRDSQIAISGFGSRGTFVHLYVNGLYWGLYNPCERPDGWFTSEHFGGARSDWFSASHGGTHGGDSARWDYLRGPLKSKDMRIAANYRELTEHLDVAAFCDYLIVTWMTGMTDWPENNWWVGNRNIAPQPLLYFGWDCEWSWDTTKGSNQGAWVHPEFRASASSNRTIAALWHSARRNTDFMTLFADRVYRACFNDGALTDANSRARWAYLNDFIREAILAESARWGDAMKINGLPTRTPADWQAEVNRLDGLMNGNAARFLAALRAEGYYPNLDPPLFRDGAAAIAKTRVGVPSGFSLRLTNSNSRGLGSILYTTDGSDPRQPGGAAAAGAINGGDDATIVLSRTTVVKARVRNGSTWSALHEAVFFVAEDLSLLKITEVMYHPAPRSLATNIPIVRIVGDAGGDDFGRARVEFSTTVAGMLAEDDRLVIRNARIAANNGSFEIESAGPNYVILSNALTDESPTGAVADLYYNGDRYEFVELKNTSTHRTLNLAGIRFTEGIEYNFPDTAQLGPGQFAVLAVRPWDFAARYPGVSCAGQFQGRLDNNGERIELSHTTGEAYNVAAIVGSVGGRGKVTFAALPQALSAGDRMRLSFARNVLNNAFYRIASIAGNDVYLTETLRDEGAGAQAVFYRVLTSVRYNDKAPWPKQADGEGRSLVPRNPNPSGDQNDPAFWAASFNLHGSPGADEPRPSVVRHWTAY